MQKQIQKVRTDVRTNAIVNEKPTIAITLVDSEDVKTGRAVGSNGTRYSKYSDTISPHLEWLKDSIAKSKDGHIRVRVADISLAMGPGYVKKDPTSIYWGLKYALYKEWIVVTTGTNVAGEKILVMRTRTKDDYLPGSLDKQYQKELQNGNKTNGVKVTVKLQAPKVQVPKVQIPVSEVVPKVPMVRRMITAMRVRYEPEAVVTEDEVKIEGELVQA